MPERYEPSAARAGRDRKEDEGRREKGWLKLYLDDRDRAGDVPAIEKRAEAERWVESVEDIKLFGADLPGEKLHGLVVELYRGQCLVEIIPEGSGEIPGGLPGGSNAPAVADQGGAPVAGASGAVASAADPSCAETSGAGEGRSGAAVAGTVIAGEAEHLPHAGTGAAGADAGCGPSGGADGGSMSWAENLPAAGRGERRLVRCVARGLLKQFDTGYRNLLAVGDRVNLVIPDARGEAPGDAQGFITRILPRRHCVERVAPGWRAVQLLAANVDLLVIVASADEPPFKPGFVDRALLLAEAADIRPLIVLNKADLGVSGEMRRHLDDFAAAGYGTLITSAVRGDGIEELKARLSGKVSVLNGQSGVGKSSLLAAMDPA
ncbi:MAG: ribosome small subunit-dependent GTPase A, partial [Planctomycetota bacterium]|nr:ribosome small subunit-dependent GTPase A [Planctomycetota bacterium]